VLAQAEVVAQLLADRHALAALAGATGYAPELGRLRAELALARGDTNDAIARAEQAASLAEEQHNEVEIGVAYAVAARALASQGRVEEAYDQFSRAVEHLDHVDRYEAARARLAWATTLPQLDPSLIRSLLEEARAGFARLGAAAELAEATARLAQA
jgi:tetratricopeptide (TPR) repeat protein